MSDKVTPISESPAAKNVRDKVLEVLKHYMETDADPGEAPDGLSNSEATSWAQGYDMAVLDINAAIRAALGEV